MTSFGRKIFFDARLRSGEEAPDPALCSLLKAMAPLLAPEEYLHVLVSHDGDMQWLDSEERVLRHVSRAAPDTLCGRWNLFRALIKIKPDVVHTVKCAPPAFAPGRVVFSMPPVMIPSDGERVVLEGGFLDKLRTMRALRRARRIICPTMALGEIAGRLAGRRALARVAIVRPGIDMSLFHPEDPAVLESTKITSRLPDKFLLVEDGLPKTGNIIPVLEAVKRIDSTETLPLVIMDATPAVRRAAAHAHLEESVIFINPESEEKRRRILCAAHLYLAPSLEDGMHKRILAAAAAGIPVVASALPGSMELFRNAAKFVQPLDPLEWARAIRSATMSLDWAEVARNNAMALAKSLSWTRAASDMLFEYRQLYKQTRKTSKRAKRRL